MIGDGFDFLCVPLVHPRHRRDSAATGVSKARAGAFTRSDLLLPSSSWTRSVVGKLSPWLWPALESQGQDGEFSPCRRNAEDALKQVRCSLSLHKSLSRTLIEKNKKLQGARMGEPSLSSGRSLPTGSFD